MKRSIAVFLILLAHAWRSSTASFVIRRGFSAADQPSCLRACHGANRAQHLAFRAARETNRIRFPPLRNSWRKLARISQIAARTATATTAPANQISAKISIPKPPISACPPRKISPTAKSTTSSKTASASPACPPGEIHTSTQDDTDAWKLVLFVRSLAGLTPQEHSQQAATAKSAHYVGSAACQKCHEQIYEHWKKTPMANVVRDPREHPEAIIPDLATNNVARNSPRTDVAFVYGSIWKQRYFTKIGDDYFPQPAQWDVTNHVWQPYFVAKGTDWWEPFYPADNMKRPTGPTCDGCHSVDYNIHTKQVAEWNVGCERCHGPGSEHVAPSHARQHPESRAHGLRRRQRHLHPVPLARPPAHESHRREILRLAGRLSRGPESREISGNSKITRSANRPSPISPTAPRTKTACKATTSSKA